MEEKARKDEHAHEEEHQQQMGPEEPQGGRPEFQQYANPYEMGMMGGYPQQPHMPNPQQMMPPQGFPYYMQQPAYGYMHQPQPMMYPQQPVMPPQGYYAQEPVQHGYQPSQAGGEGCGHHQEMDPLSGIMGMFGDMIGNNPQLNEVSKMINSTGSDFLKGMLVGAGVAMLMSSETVRSALTDIFTKTLGGEEEEA